MGDVSEMMLDGVLCQECGEYIESKAPGHPRTCAACFDEGQSDDEELAYATDCEWPNTGRY